MCDICLNMQKSTHTNWHKLQYWHMKNCTALVNGWRFQVFIYITVICVINPEDMAHQWMRLLRRCHALPRSVTTEAAWSWWSMASLVARLGSGATHIFKWHEFRMRLYSSIFHKSWWLTVNIVAVRQTWSEIRQVFSTKKFMTTVREWQCCPSKSKSAWRPWLESSPGLSPFQCWHWRKNYWLTCSHVLFLPYQTWLGNPVVHRGLGLVCFHQNLGKLSAMSTTDFLANLRHPDHPVPSFSVACGL